MANAKKCDRCGKFYEYYNTSFRTGSQSVNKIALCRMENRENYMVDHMDLCPDCLKEVLYFIFGDDVDIRPYLGEVKE